MKLRLAAQKLAKTATHVVGRYWGEHFPLYYVSEYPKSGGTWLAQMVADYLQIPFPRYSVFPIGCEAVVLNHWRYDHRLRRVIYLYRDGRDVMTSLFFHRLRIAREPSHPASRRIRSDLAAVFGPDFEDRDTGTLLARFIDQEFRNPRLGSRVNWSTHVSEWGAAEARAHIAYASYENLLTDTQGELARLIGDITTGTAAPDAERVEAAVERFSMKAQTGRKPGEEDARHHVRKGIAGDWKNHFTRECAEIFNHHAGDALVALGYEPDSAWVEGLSAGREEG